jgi:hypothetical protein
MGFEPTFPAFERGEDTSCLRPRGHCDQRNVSLPNEINRISGADFVSDKRIKWVNELCIIKERTFVS